MQIYLHDNKCITGTNYDRLIDSSILSIRDSYVRLGSAQLSRILPTPFVLMSGYANMENVSYFLNANISA